MFKSFYMAGFECATGVNAHGQWIDQIEATEHDRFADEDYARLADARLFTQVAKSGDTPELRSGSWYHLGELAFEGNRLDEAVQAFDACLLERPEHGRARAWVALIRGRREEQAGRLEGARDAYREALAGGAPLAKYGLASAMKRLGDLAGAEPLFADVAATADRPEIRGGAQFHLGEIARAGGRQADAAGHFESCLLELPDHAAAERRLAELEVGAR